MRVRGGKRGIEPAEVFWEETETLTLFRDDRLRRGPRLVRDAGVSVRIWTGEGDRIACRAGRSIDAVRECLTELGVDPRREFGGLPEAAADPLAALRDPLPSVLDRAGAIDAWADRVGSEAGRQSGAAPIAIRVEDRIRRVAVLLPDGRLAAKTEGWTHVSFLGTRWGGYFQTGCPAAADLERCLPPGSCIESIRARAIPEGADPEPPRPGRVPIVLGGQAAGIFFHEICGHLLETEPGEEAPRRTLAGAAGLPADLTVFDDPTAAGFGGTAPFDDEGVPCGRTVLIEAGRVTGALLDRRAARAAGRRPTGHGRRESYRDRPLARIGNLFVRGGASAAGAAIGSCDRGLFAEEIGGGRIDPRSGRFRLTVERGARIHGGRLKGPVGPFVLSGEAAGSLAGIEIVEPDEAAVPETGRCRKEGQAILTGLASPPVRLGRLDVRPA